MAVAGLYFARARMPGVNDLAVEDPEIVAGAPADKGPIWTPDRCRSPAAALWPCVC